MAPDKIDKLVWNRGVLKMVADSFAAHPSTEKTKGRRKDLTSILGLNSSSKYIPTMLEVTKEVLAEMKKLKDVNYLNHMNNLTVKILSNLLFGKDIHYLIEKKYTYQNHDGTSDELNLLDFFFKHCENLVAEYYNPITTLLPFVDKNNLFGLWKRNHVNDIQFKTRLTEIVEKSKDENSLWSQMKALNHYSSEDIFSDLIILLLGGTESTSHSLVSLFFYLAKHPDVKEKLVKELRDMGFHKNEELYHTKIHDCDYLNYVVKEVFRIDAPVTRGFYYVAKEDINI